MQATKEKQNGTDVRGPVSGIFLEKTKEKISIYQAMKKRLLKPATALALLEAQAATVGIIDPINNKILSVRDAVKMGIVGPEMKEKLLTAEQAITGYIDPYTNQTISVFQAMQKDLVTRVYGLRLLEAQIATKGLFDPIAKTHVSIETGIGKGYYEKGLLDNKMEELKVLYDPTAQKNVSYQALLERCTVEPDTGLLLLPVCITFRGLRRGISSTELLASKIIDKETFEDLQKGKTTTQEVMLMETVKEYLQGKGSIAGIALLSSNQRMSIYQAMKKGILMPGTALVLLEAQAATGFMIDPVENKKFTVDEAVRNKLVGPEYTAKLRSAERAVTGYKDPYSGEIISLFQALSKDLIVREHGIRLLEAQIATGGIIDPINSHRLPTEIAFKRGYFNKEMNVILESSGDDTKGFFDPNTEANLTYLQLMERCVIDPVTGLCLLPLHDKSDAQNFNFIEYQTKMVFKNEKVKVMHGKYIGMTVSLWELLMSEYFDEHQRQDVFKKYREGKLDIKTIIKTVLEIIETSVTTTVVFQGIRETVTAEQLVAADIISKQTEDDLIKGKMSMKEVMEDEHVNMYLKGTGSIAGVLLPNSQIMTIYQARQKGKLMPGTALILLEAQAATGFVIDPIGNRTFSVDDAVKANIVGPDVCQKLRSAERAVTGYRNPYDGKIISLFQAMQNDLIVKEHGIRLLEAQIATGGIIDPVNSHRIPVHVAYKRGYFNEEMNQILDDPSDDTKGFFDPNTQENLTYLQLLERCVTDPITGLCLLPLKGKTHKINIKDNMWEILKTTTVTVKYGRFKGKHTTLWDIINSEYLSEDKRQELFKLFRLKKITVEQLTVTILEIIRAKEIKQQEELYFGGLREKVSVSTLLELEIVDEKTITSLINGNKTSDEVMNMESVRKYLQGTGCVAGVVLQPSNRKLSIYEAQKSGVLTPGTALCLLEAQAATGFIVDPLRNERFTVAKALKENVICPQMYEKLLSAERAVTGYRDPYTGHKISLFQALEKDLIVRQHGIRLLEAQIATGGIIDPLTCIHLPLEVAYKKGYFDAELNQILLDPNDDTKGFFDPKTHENLTYAQMLDRCVKDKETGLFLLPLDEKRKVTATEEKRYTEAEIQQEFQKTVVSVSVGCYSGKSVSLWDLLHSRYFTDDQMLEIIEKFRTRQITIQTIITMIISTIENLEKSEAPKMIMGLRKLVSAQQLLDSDVITADTFKKVKEGNVAFETVAQEESVKRYLKGTGSIAGIKVLPSQKVMRIYEAKNEDLLTPGMALLLLEAQAATGWIIDPLQNKCYNVDDAIKEKVIGPDVREQLLLAERAVTGYEDPYTDITIPLFKSMKEQLFPRSNALRLLEVQLATGGIIDPNQSHRLPVHVAIRKGYLDEETREILLKPTDTTKGFLDPNTKESLTYLQLINRCEKDPKTGLLLFPLNTEVSHEFHIDEQIELALKNKIITLNAGTFKGKGVSVWEVLRSAYISEKKREQLIQQYRTKTLTIEEMIEILTAIVTEVSSKEKKFKGLRKQVSASELYESKIISKELFSQIIQGEITPEKVTKMESVRKFLGATNCIAGVRVESTKKVMSIYEAKSKGLLTPGTSLVLLEAQAATGFVIDPVNNKKLSVEEAVALGVVGGEWKKKLLSAERAVTGYKDPYTGDTISLFQSLQKDLIVKDHGIRLLEAQIATGGIIDPVYSHRVPVQVAYQRGYFDEEMNQVLCDADDDTKGFFDPNTKENLTYLQLVERCVIDPVTGFNLLPIVKKGEFYFYVDEATKLILKSMTTTEAGGKYKGSVVSLWDLIYSRYITEEKRQELVKQFKSGSITIERFLEIILTIVEQKTTTTTSLSSIVTCPPPETKEDSSTTKTSSNATKTTTITEITEVDTFHGIRKDVTASELLKSNIIDKDLYEELRSGKVTVTEVSNMASVSKYLEGTNCIAGVYLQSTKQTMSIYEAKSKGLLTPGTTLVLLEAQAATGFVIDPVNNKKLSVEEAVALGVVGREWKNKLLSAERAVTGYRDPYTEDTISLFQALQKDLIVKDHGIRLLEAQIATGGIIDPVYSHRVPVQVAYQRGYFDEEMNQILSDADDDTKGFFDPNTKENLTYLQLVERCITDPITGLSLLVIVNKGEFYFFVDEATKLILKSKTSTRAGGEYHGTTVSLWDLLYSRYITEEKRRELVKQFKSGALTIERFLEIILTIVEQKTTTTTSLSSIVTCPPPETKEDSSTTKTSSNTTKTTTITEITEVDTFHGIRKDVTASELLKSNIIDKDLYEELRSGKVTVTEVSNMASVSKYLEGTNCIAGVYLQSTKQTMSIYEAKSKGLLTPGTTLVLLEAQAATGFVIDPVNNKKLSVEEAVALGVVGGEWKNKLLSAERAVTGYRDPYTEDTISLFQALQKDLIVKDHGIRLLEAQIATGGIIDPVYSHRVPVQVAYQRGYFDEEMNQILSDADDDTKGFFDPNTKENLTYLQLVERCITDPITGLSLLVIVNKGEFYFFVDEATKLILKSKTTTRAGGEYHGTTVSLWDLLYSRYITEEKRRELVKQFKSGAITIERFLEIILTIVEQKTTTTTTTSLSSIVTCPPPETKEDSSTTKTSSNTTKTTTITEITEVDTFHGIRKDVTASELLKSNIIDKDLYEELRSGKVTVTEVSNMASVSKYLEGTNCIAGVYLQSTKQTMSIYEAKSKGLLTPGTTLVLLEAQAATGFVIDPVNNKKLSVEEAVALGVVGGEWKNKLLSAERAVTGYRDPYTEDTISLFQALQKDLIVKDHGIRLLEAQIATGGIIDPVYSHRVPVQVAYQRGYFDEEMNQILSDADDDTKGFFDPNTKENLTYLQLVERCITDPITGLSLLVIVNKGEFYFFVDEATKLILKSKTTTRAGGEYHGTTVSLWDLLYSRYITEEKRRELVKQFKSGAITIERFLEIILTIVEQKTTTTTTTSLSSIVTCPPPETKEDSSTTKTSSNTTKTTTITEITEVDTFHGIRKDVTASELLKSNIIDKDLYEELRSGKVTVTEVSNMASVSKYLEGTNCIAGVYLQSTKQTMSIYEAKSKGLLTPGTTLVLLEAQAATGFVIDPVNNKKLSVEEAVALGVVGGEWKNKLLSAERAVTGYRDPYTEDTISLFQALQKDLIVKDHGIRLLEAQIATGGIIDPVYSHRVPVQVAYQRGYFDEEMNQILSDADDDTKGFFDPNTKENLTYLQLVERCITDPITGLSLLVIVNKGEFYFFVDEATKLILKSKTTTRAGGEYHGTTVSLWDLLYSRYITEEKRRELVKQFKSGAITIERFLEIILTIVEQKTTTTTTTSLSSIVTCPPPETKEDSSTTKTSSNTTKTTTITEITEVDTFHGIRKDVTASELLKSNIIDKDLYEELRSGKVTVTEVSNMASVSKYLEGTNCIAGVYLQSTKQTMSIYEAKSKGLLTPGTTLVLLEAQAATGFVIDPVNNKKLSVEEAVALGVVGGEWKNKLLSAERAVTGYRDPYTEDTISLFQALQKDLIVKDHGIRLLEAQIATGGIIDPVYSHRVPVQVAYQRGYFDEEMNQILSDADDDTKGFFDPNTKENLTYLQLVERCITDPITGLSLLVIVNKGEFYFFVDEATKLILKSKTTTRAGGEYHGTTVSLWDLLYSRYITEEKRRELVKQFKSGAITIERFLEIILTIVEQKTTTTTTSLSSIVTCPPPETKEDSSTTKTSSNTTKTTTITEITEVDTFHGIRKDVTASELLKSNIIDKDLYEELRSGKVTVTEVSNMASVSKYLEGTNCIAGVYLQSTKQTMSIYEAKSKGLLTPGTSLVLLEAQAATGFVIDPVNNKKLSVEEAVALGVVGREWKNKLLSAERAVTGYRDPYTEDTISLFQALQKDLIVRDHGIRLLEAQIATGGIIDPVYSHRVPVQVAYQRGYFDEEMNQILSDADDDTKGFFDPNTKENLTYLKLVERCVTDPITGLSLLPLHK